MSHLDESEYDDPAADDARPARVATRPPTARRTTPAGGPAGRGRRGRDDGRGADRAVEARRRPHPGTTPDRPGRRTGGAVPRGTPPVWIGATWRRAGPTPPRSRTAVLAARPESDAGRRRVSAALARRRRTAFAPTASYDRTRRFAWHLARGRIRAAGSDDSDLGRRHLAGRGEPEPAKAPGRAQPAGRDRRRRRPGRAGPRRRCSSGGRRSWAWSPSRSASASGSWSGRSGPAGPTRR